MRSIIRVPEFICSERRRDFPSKARCVCQFQFDSQRRSRRGGYSGKRTACRSARLPSPRVVRSANRAARQAAIDPLAPISDPHRINGRHLYFRHPDRPVMNRVGLRPGLDLRGDGGCVVAPPSMHPTGRCYTRAAHRSPDEVSPASLPHWLLSAFDVMSKGHPVAHWRSLVRAADRLLTTWKSSES
jgi:hypothetical protein